MWSSLALAFGLAMDATAVSAARGIVGSSRELVILPLLFGAFQAAMAAFGWITGEWGGDYFEAWNQWIAFGLLAGMGVKMVLDALRPHAVRKQRSGAALYLALAVATSMDAAAAGIALPLIPVDPWLSIALIGGVTALCSVAGFALGRAIGDRFGARLGVVGGVVLIALGVRILVTS